ncbi:hypothetical protein K493DRAFT_304394 [Basidiobolus meristosporus CBS 931.73]|uniref:Uncharacterized protein n=1 Tax=Basidiobolus meristosporus CBS 931.73 TaxID=1314790 RepID=A0A1Y1XZ74_9FUNG|nr:hypothetical protein K493DRAFT_304394 [Basidiobolus meristosporus CBS 931.73]|eukprot:ORX91041.1 hypothetical protein K493DRAFT_304394 [Basidiobolus meristosporus CBS 931.73]
MTQEIPSESKNRKHVMFSSECLGPATSTPDSSRPRKTKGILKTPSKPTEQELKELDEMQSQSALSDFVTPALEALKKGDSNDCVDAYITIHNKFRLKDENQQLRKVEANINEFVAVFKRDIGNSPDVNVIQNLHFARQGSDLLHMCLVIPNLIFSPKIRMAPTVIAPMASTLVDAVVFASGSTHKSVTIQNEALTALDVIFKQVPYAASSEARSWLLPVINYSINSIPGLRAKALQVIQTSLIDLIKHHDKIGTILDVRLALRLSNPQQTLIIPHPCNRSL